MSGSLNQSQSGPQESKVSDSPWTSILTPEDLKSRLSFLKGGVDPFVDGKTTGMRVETFTLEAGTYIPLTPYKAELTLDFVRAQVLSIGREERVQYLTNHADNGKAYFYNESLQMYSISCFMIDSDLTPQQESDTRTISHTISRWKKFYETEIRVSAIVPRNLIVSIKWRGVTYWGYVLSYNLSLSASDPNVAILGLVFLCIWDDNQYELPQLDRNGEIMSADLTREGYEMIFHEQLGEKEMVATSRVGKQLEMAKSYDRLNRRYVP